MQIFKSGTALRIETAESREAETQTHILRFPAHDEPTPGLKRALQALGIAYEKVAHALDLRLAAANSEDDVLAQLSNNCSWISDRRRLVQSFLDCELAAAAYVEMRDPDQIHALAEAAGAFAEESHQLFSALGLLSYIEHELGWTAARLVPAGNA
ncbi:MAG TPA: hypothetical protein VMW18_14675 [Candidatus Binatia bacterium]|nr:hypothetical protein [Candidatus Binatia bacterium]